MRKGKEPETCEHEWKQFKQTIQPDNANRPEHMQYDFRHSERYFLISACVKCKKKEYKDLVLR